MYTHLSTMIISTLCEMITATSGTSHVGGDDYDVMRLDELRNGTGQVSNRGGASTL